jgi:hypothetical protein
MQTTTHFEPQEHIYKTDSFQELIKDALRFFNGTPVHPLPGSPVQVSQNRRTFTAA